MKQAFAYYTDMPLTLFGFILFITVFVSWVIWTGLKINRQKYERISKDLLIDGENHESRA